MAETVQETIEETVALMPEPTKELAERATRRVDWIDRFKAYRMAAGAGTVAEDLYSFADIGRFIMGTDWRKADSVDAKVAFNWVDMTKLANWLESVAEDKDLANAVRESTVDPDAAYKAQVEAVGPILVARFEQYQAALGVEDEKPE